MATRPPHAESDADIVAESEPAAADPDPDKLDELDVRALTEYLTVLDDVGLARGAPDLYLVVSQSGKEYTVDAREGACDCPDARYRDRHCKHARRVEFATGAREIPAWVARERVDDQLGRHVDGGPESPGSADAGAGAD